ncbi:MAG: arginase [Saprospiraceae bacterium]|jgi:arginase
MKKVTLLEVDSELGAGTRGSSLGISALKIAALTAGDHFFADHPRLRIPNCNEYLYRPVDTPHAIHLDGIVKMLERVSGGVRDCVQEGGFPLVLSGDHSSAAGTIAGLKAALGEGRRLGVIWIDAHADLHSPYTTPSGNVHGMPLAIALSEDNLDHQSNEIVGKTKILWERAKAVCQPGPWIKPEDLVFIGLRDYETQEAHLINSLDINVVSVRQVRRDGAEEIARQVRHMLDACDCLYVSFDVDSLDCDLVSDGTGTPVPDGLTVDEARGLIMGFGEDPRLCALEIMEVNPVLDTKGNKMAEAAFHILQYFVRNSRSFGHHPVNKTRDSVVEASS